ncbi:MAG: UDP-N-acetylmuramoyl-tripeptide--D-alanyl-D-alanine ligase, partial [Caulobacteraceae bacterium]|nr:UDP-N-acetylmuramoyl-tripeptide--D-alanyl-D-alanine ligase [Caulobacteraceae bacterium]
MAERLWTSDEIARATGGQAFGQPFVAGGVSIDSRTLAHGDLFVALKAERDGHDFVRAALDAGASGVLVERGAGPAGVRVSDGLVALTDLARVARARADGAVVGAVTGSVGKTTVTQMVLAGLRAAEARGAGRAHGSVKSYNNHIGVPLTLARMPGETRRAVFEIGMNHAGEISPLARLVRPDVVAITNVAAVHVENFADGESGVARAKSEIFDGVAPGGRAILDADGPWFQTLAGRARDLGLTVWRFGKARDAEARLLRFDGGRLSAEVMGRRVELALGKSAAHWGTMSLCALLMLRALEVDDDIA